MKLFPGFQGSSWWGTKWPALLERNSQESLTLTLEWGRSKPMLSAYFMGVFMTLHVRWCKRSRSALFSTGLGGILICLVMVWMRLLQMPAGTRKTHASFKLCWEYRVKTLCLLSRKEQS